MRTGHVISIAAVLCANCLCATGFAQGYITLKGDQFYDEYDAPFYPMVMNYIADYAFPDVDGAPLPDMSNCHLARSSVYGSTQDHDYGTDPLSSWPSKFIQDFNEMKNLGFNTVRFCLKAFKLDGVGYFIEVMRFPQADPRAYVDIFPSYDPATNDVFAFHVNTLIEVCSLANVVGMKVIVGVEGGFSIHGQTNIDDCAAFCAAIAGAINEADVHNLLAFEFIGEPTYAEGPWADRHTKAEICEIVELWHDAVKAADPEHLTTIGGVWDNDVFKGGWDPNLLKVDFANMHFYPIPARHEYDDPSNAVAASMAERYKNMLYLYDQKLRKPYIIMETGFPGRNDDGFGHYYYPFNVLGDEQDQLDFVNSTFPAIWNSKASGYGWWEFQDKHWWHDGITPGPWPPPPALGLEQYSGDFFGLSGWGDPTPDLLNGYSAYRKLAAQAFIDWKTTPPASAPPDHGPISPMLDMSETYYNPYQHPPNPSVYPPGGAPTNYGTLTGQVLDQFGIPIAGAVVKGASYVDRDGSGPIQYVYHTYTDENGEFELRAWDYSPGPFNVAFPFKPYPEAHDQIIENLAIGSYNSEWVEVGWDAGGTFQPNSTYWANSLQSRFDVTVDDFGIFTGQTQDLEALWSITTLDFAVQGNLVDDGGHSQMRSRTIDIKPGFHAELGADVHIHAQVMALECAEVAAADLKSAMVSHIRARADVEDRSKFVDVEFHGSPYLLEAEVFPNPSSGVFTIVLHPIDGSETARVSTIDRLGRVLRRVEFTGQRYALDLSEMSSGAYTLLIESNDTKLYRSIVLDHNDR